ncbi:MAG: hypothetical protein AAF528_05975, partial [Cyanobacteria bacterium P01_C01_bin.121]
MHNITRAMQGYVPIVSVVIGQADMQGLFLSKRLGTALLLATLGVGTTVLPVAAQAIDGQLQTLPARSVFAEEERHTSAVLGAEHNEIIQWAKLLGRINPGDDVAIAALKQVIDNPQTAAIAVEAMIALHTLDID